MGKPGNEAGSCLGVDMVGVCTPAGMKWSNGLHNKQIQFHCDYVCLSCEVHVARFNGV